MKYVRQFRYYSDGSEKNYPQGLTNKMLTEDNIFRDCGFITQMGIQAAPGTIFFLNSSIHPITVGSTGIYELDLEGLSSISSIRFQDTSLTNVNDETDGIIIDIVYEGAGVNG